MNWIELYFEFKTICGIISVIVLIAWWIFVLFISKGE